MVAFAPHQQLIARSALVITHAGLNTTLTALGCGVPLRALVATLLREERYRQAAKRLQAEIAGAGGVARAADLIEGCLVSD